MLYQFLILRSSVSTRYLTMVASHNFRQSQNMLLIHYEDLHDHFEREVSRLTSFLNIAPLSDDNLQLLREKTHVGVMKQRYSEAERQVMTSSISFNSKKYSFPAAPEQINTQEGKGNLGVTIRLQKLFDWGMREITQ